MREEEKAFLERRVAEQKELSRRTRSREAALAHLALAEAYAAKLAAKTEAPKPSVINE